MNVNSNHMKLKLHYQQILDLTGGMVVVDAYRVSARFSADVPQLRRWPSLLGRSAGGDTHPLHTGGHCPPSLCASAFDGVAKPAAVRVRVRLSGGVAHH